MGLAFAFVDNCFALFYLFIYLFWQRWGYGLSLVLSIKVNKMQKDLQCPLLWRIKLKVTNGGKTDQYLFGLEFQSIMGHLLLP